MALKDDIAAIRADGTKTDRRRQLDIYNLKVGALHDVIVNGKPAPNPIPPLLNRTFTLDGTTIRVNACSIVNRVGSDGEVVPTLYVDVTLTRGAVTDTHQVYYVNPPILPRSESGNEKDDLIQAAAEIIAQLPVG